MKIPKLDLNKKHDSTYGESPHRFQQNGYWYGADHQPTAKLVDGVTYPLEQEVVPRPLEAGPAVVKKVMGVTDEALSADDAREVLKRRNIQSLRKLAREAEAPAELLEDTSDEARPNLIEWLVENLARVVKEDVGNEPPPAQD